MIGFEALGGRERGLHASRRTSGQKRGSDGGIDLLATHLQAANAAPIDHSASPAIVGRRGVAAVVEHAQSASAAPAHGKALQQCDPLTHRAARLMRTRTDVGANALLISQVRLPADVARMMLRNEDTPLAASQVAGSLAHTPRGIQVALPTRLAVRVGTGVDRIGEHMVDAQIRWLHPLDWFSWNTSKWKQQLFRAKPQPHAADGAELGEAVKYGPDGGGDRFIRVPAHLAVCFAPHQAHR